MTLNSKPKAVDDLSIYDRSGAKASGSGRLLLATLLSMGVLAGGVFVIEYGLFDGAPDTEKAVAQKQNAPSVVHGVISRTPVVPMEREAEATGADSAVVEAPDAPTNADVTLVNAVNSAERSTLEESAREGLEEAAAQVGVNQATPVITADDILPEAVSNGTAVTVVLPVDERPDTDVLDVEEVSMEEVQRLYSSSAVQQETLFVEAPEESLERVALPESVEPEPAEPAPVAVDKPVRRAVREKVPDVRCTIARRELAAVRSSLANLETDAEGKAYLVDQQSYYRDQVRRYCR